LLLLCFITAGFGRIQIVLLRVRSFVVLPPYLYTSQIFDIWALEMEFKRIFGEFSAGSFLNGLKKATVTKPFWNSPLPLLSLVFLSHLPFSAYI
jgi:hypothetical protein